MALCKNCGTEITDGGKFCPSCGTATTAISEGAGQEKGFAFHKGKMMGTVTYKRVDTTISVSGNQLAVHQISKRIFCRERLQENAVPLSSIESARIRTVMDFWDTLYAIISAVLGIFHPSWFLLTAVCLFCGYGKEIKIKLSDGNQIKIPLAGSKADAQELLSICNQ